MGKCLITTAKFLHSPLAIILSKWNAWNPQFYRSITRAKKCQSNHKMFLSFLYIFCVLYILPYSRENIYDICLFGNQLISVHLVDSSDIHFVAEDMKTFFFCDSVVFYSICMPHFLYLVILWRTSGFFVLAVVSSAAVNMGVQVMLWYSDFHFVWENS